MKKLDEDTMAVLRAAEQLLEEGDFSIAEFEQHADGTLAAERSRKLDEAIQKLIIRNILEDMVERGELTKEPGPTPGKDIFRRVKKRDDFVVDNYWPSPTKH